MRWITLNSRCLEVKGRSKRGGSNDERESKMVAGRRMTRNGDRAEKWEQKMMMAEVM